MKSKKTCHPDSFIYPINDSAILQMELTEEKKIKDVKIHSTESSTYLIQL